MNNTDSFVNPLQTVHFISVFSSIKILSDIFYDEKITIESTDKPIPIINTLCQYLHDNDTEEAIIALGKKILKNSDLYGSRENETVHIDYIDAMMNNIIASTVFAGFGNTFGYLSSIVMLTSNLTLSSVKKTIITDLKSRKYSNEDGTISNLSYLTITRVTEKLIFPFFPQPEHDMKIVDVDYIYAQAGLMLTRIAGIKSSDISFDGYITLSQTIEQAVVDGGMSQDALSIFRLPALLHYSYKKKNVLKGQEIWNKITDPLFWDDVFHLLFSNLNAAYEKMKKIGESAANKFYTAYSGYKTRTKLAEKILGDLCPLEYQRDPAKAVNDYKSHNDNYDCPTNNKTMPDINKLFSEQNKDIVKYYSSFEKALIEEAFSNARKYVEQPNVKVLPVIIYRRLPYYGTLPFHVIKLNDSINLFMTVRDDEYTHLHALIRDKTGMKLITSPSDTKWFLRQIGVNENLDLNFLPDTPALKSGSETFETFLTNLVKPRETNFLNLLEREGYDPTTRETLVEFFKNFIPFYPCVKASQTEDAANIAFTCVLDTLSLFPVIRGVVNFGYKFVNAATKSLIIGYGTSLQTFLARQSIKAALKTGIGMVAKEASKGTSKLITKELFKDLGVAVLRSVDPGFELLYSFGKKGLSALNKCLSLVAQKIPSFRHVLQSFKKLKRIVRLTVQNFKNHYVYVHSISGKDGYGTKYFRLKEQNVELRRVIGSESEQPVVLISDPKSSQAMYQKIDTITWKPDGKDLVVRNDVLVNAPPPFEIRTNNVEVNGLSGKGKLPISRVADKVHMDATKKEAIEDIKKNIDKKTAIETLSHYVLEEERRTPDVFVRDWVRLKKLPDWSKNLRVENVELYENLRYSPYLDDLDLTEDVAVKSIEGCYGGVRARIDVNQRHLFQQYSQNKLQSMISFKDYYAIANWRKTGHSRISLESAEALQMKRAFFRLAIRQADDPFVVFPRTLYQGANSHFHQITMVFVGKTLKLDSFIGGFTEMTEALELLLASVLRKPKLKTIFELKFHDSYLAVNIERIFPGASRKIVLLPDMKFRVEKRNKYRINNEEVHIVTMRYIPPELGKSEAIATLANKIKRLDDWESQFYKNTLVKK